MQHVGVAKLSPEQRQILKHVVEAELIIMQDMNAKSALSESAATGERRHTHTHPKRKREEEEEEEEETTTKAKTKKSRLEKSPERSREEEKKGEEDEDDEDEDHEEEGRADSGGGGVPQVSSEEEEEEEERPLKVKKQKKRRKPQQRPKQPISSANDSEDQSEEEEKTMKQEEDASSDEEETPARKGSREGVGPAVSGALPGDSDSSSSLPSLDDEEEPKPRAEPKEEVKKTVTKRRKREEEEEGGKEEHKAVSRLKRYIALCGVRRNYKRLLDGCRSVKAKVAVLKKELEDLGVKGQPSIERCKRARLKREQALELAELDMSNIISTEGRPRRRAATGGCSPVPSAYKRSVASDSDSPTTGRRQRATDWSSLRGIISDEDSD